MTNMDITQTIERIRRLQNELAAAEAKVEVAEVSLAEQQVITAKEFGTSDSMELTTLLAAKQEELTQLLKSIDTILLETPTA